MTDYKLVPVEPTWAMEVAGQHALEAGCYASGIYADMLAAAPDVYRHPATPSFLEYPSFEESANFDPVPAPQPVDDGLSTAVEVVADRLATDRVYERWQAVEDLRDALAAYRKGVEV